MAVVATVVAAGAAWAVLPRLLAVIERAGFVRPNYLGQAVPCAAGAALALIYGTLLLLMMAWDAAWRALATGRQPQEPIAPYWTALVVVTFAMALVGLVDDVFGDRTATGWRGHLAQLGAGRLTTGAVKAAFGGVVGLAGAVLVSGGLRDWVLNAGLVPLSANALNLLDVRPGRAVKGFCVLVALLWAGTVAHPVWAYVAPLLAVAAVYLPWDLQARAMLGDAGANFLGGVLGVAAATALPALARLALLVVLLALHVQAERASLSQLIDRVAPLRWLDEWGRR